MDNDIANTLKDLFELRTDQNAWDAFVLDLNDRAKRGGTAADAAIAGGQQVQVQAPVQAPGQQVANQAPGQQVAIQAPGQQLSIRQQVLNQPLNPLLDGAREEGGVLSGLDPQERDRMTLLLNKQFLTANERNALTALRAKSGNRRVVGSRAVVPFGFTVVDVEPENPREIFDSVTKKNRVDLTQEEVREFNEAIKILPKAERDYKHIVKSSLRPMTVDNPFHRTQKGYKANERRARNETGLLASIGDPFRVEFIPAALRTPIPVRKRYVKHKYVPKIEVHTGFERTNRRN